MDCIEPLVVYSNIVLTVSCRVVLLGCCNLRNRIKTRVPSLKVIDVLTGLGCARYEEFSTNDDRVLGAVV